MSNLQRQADLSPHHERILQQLEKQTEELKEFSESIPSSGDKMDLDAELEAIASLVEEEVTPTPLEDSVPMVEELRQDILELLQSRKDAPTQDQIDAWKEQYGSDAIQVIGLDRENVYVYTHLTLPQWEKINDIVAKVQGTPMAEQINSLIREKVIRTAILWPELDGNFFKRCRAGLPDTLYQLILIQSYFLSPQQAMTLTTQL